MLYPPPEGTGIMYTKTNYIKFCAATVISLAENYPLTMLNIGLLMEASVAAYIVIHVNCILDTNRCRSALYQSICVVITWI